MTQAQLIAACIEARQTAIEANKTLAPWTVESRVGAAVALAIDAYQKKNS